MAVDVDEVVVSLDYVVAGAGVAVHVVVVDDDNGAGAVDLVENES